MGTKLELIILSYFLRCVEKALFLDKIGIKDEILKMDVVARLIGVIVAILASLTFYGTGHPVLLGLAVFTVFLCVWSWGAMHEFASNWVVPLNLIFTFLGAGLLVWGIIIRFF